MRSNRTSTIPKSVLQRKISEGEMLRVAYLMHAVSFVGLQPIRCRSETLLAVIAVIITARASGTKAHRRARHRHVRYKDLLHSSPWSVREIFPNGVELPHLVLLRSSVTLHEVANQTS